MLNKIILLGRLTETPELKTTSNGTSVTSFSLAVQRNFDREQTDFINCVAWRHTAEFITKYWMKGQLILVEGELQSRKYKDRDGNNRTAFEVVVSQAYFCEGKAKNENMGEFKPTMTPASADDFEEIAGDDVLPF